MIERGYIGLVIASRFGPRYAITRYLTSDEGMTRGLYEAACDCGETVTLWIDYTRSRWRRIRGCSFSAHQARIAA